MQYAGVFQLGPGPKLTYRHVQPCPGLIEMIQIWQKMTKARTNRRAVPRQPRIPQTTVSSGHKHKETRDLHRFLLQTYILAFSVKEQTVLQAHIVYVGLLACRNLKKRFSKALNKGGGLYGPLGNIVCIKR